MTHRVPSIYSLKKSTSKVIIYFQIAFLATKACSAFMASVPHQIILPTTHKLSRFYMTSSTPQRYTAASKLFNLPISMEEATSILESYSNLQNEFTSIDGNQGMGGGISASKYWNTLPKEEIKSIAKTVSAMALQAAQERSSYEIKKKDGFSYGRVMLGICAEDTTEAIQTLKEWVSGLNLPKGLLHGMDLDGKPIEIHGSVYIKYSTGGAMTFAEMRRSKRGFDALWRPGDAVLETYDGDFRGVYFNVELEDEVFRQFGVLPLTLFHDNV